jgi:hypothetical protein
MLTRTTCRGALVVAATLVLLGLRTPQASALCCKYPPPSYYLVCHEAYCEGMVILHFCAAPPIEIGGRLTTHQYVACCTMITDTWDVSGARCWIAMAPELMAHWDVHVARFYLRTCGGNYALIHAAGKT